MTYKELKIQVSKNAQIPYDQASKAVDEVFQVLKDALVRGDRIQIPLFGVFYVKTRQPKKSLPAKRIAVFAPAIALKKEVEANTYTFKED